MGLGRFFKKTAKGALSLATAAPRGVAAAATGKSFRFVDTKSSAKSLYGQAIIGGAIVGASALGAKSGTGRPGGNTTLGLNPRVEEALKNVKSKGTIVKKAIGGNNLAPAKQIAKQVVGSTKLPAEFKKASNVVKGIKTGGLKVSKESVKKAIKGFQSNSSVVKKAKTASTVTRSNKTAKLVVPSSGRVTDSDIKSVLIGWKNYTIRKGRNMNNFTKYANEYISYHITKDSKAGQVSRYFGEGNGKSAHAYLLNLNKKPALIVETDEVDTLDQQRSESSLIMDILSIPFKIIKAILA